MINETQYETLVATGARRNGRRGWWTTAEVFDIINENSAAMNRMGRVSTVDATYHRLDRLRRQRLVEYRWAVIGPNKTDNMLEWRISPEGKQAVKQFEKANR